MLKPRGGIPFADSDLARSRSGQTMADGIFTSRSGRWGPGSGIFADRWSIPRGIYEGPPADFAGYAGANVVDSSALFREHGIYGLGVTAPPWASQTPATWALLSASEQQAILATLPEAQVPDATYTVMTRADFLRRMGVAAPVAASFLPAGSGMLGAVLVGALVLGGWLLLRAHPRSNPRRGRRWIQKAIRHPGAYRRSVAQRYGARGFDARGRVKLAVVRRDMRAGGTLGRRASLAYTLATGGRRGRRRRAR